MAGQTDFLNSMRELTRIGETSGNQLSMREISEYFGDMKLDDIQMDSICQYLEKQGIYIENRVARGEEEFFEDEMEVREDPQDQDMVEEYLKEMRHVGKVGRTEESLIIRNLMEGDETARQMLIESNLDYAVDIAREYEGQGLLLSDLIQESNIGLMLAVGDFEPAIHRDFHQYAGERIRTHLKDALKEYNQASRPARKMASRINEMNDISTAIAKEYEREASPAEIARRMGITEEEVRELMRVSLDAISVMNQEKYGEES